jgi:tetrahydromethanopterin S-methyltransferase subunit F
VNEEDFKNKLQETLEKIQNVFGEGSSEEGEGGINMENMPSANDIHSHISGMLDSKLGNLAREIAEETAQNLDIDLENMTDVKDVFQSLFKNPGKLMGLVKNVGEKLDTRIKSGEIKESELMSEASNIMSKMKNMPGMDNIQEMLSKMGMSGMMPPGMGRNARMDTNAMENKLKQYTKMEQMKEQMKKKSLQKQLQKQMEEQKMQEQILNAKPALTDEELFALCGEEKPQKTPRGSKPPPQPTTTGKKKKNKK